MACAAANFHVTRDGSADTTNPSANDVLADTGELPGGIYDIRVWVSASAAAKFRLEVRNAANDGNDGDTHICYCAANVSVDRLVRVALNPDQRVRVAMEASLTGTAAASVFAQRVA